MTDDQPQAHAEYKPALAAGLGTPRARRRYWLLLVLATGGAGAYELLDMPLTATTTAHQMLVISTVSPAGISPAPAATTATPAPPPVHNARMEVESGDSLAHMFARLDLSTTDLQAIMDTGDGTDRLKHLLPGDVINVGYTPDGHIQNLHMAYDDAHTLLVQRKDGNYSASVNLIPTTVTTAYAHGVIEDSLFDSATRAGLSDGTTMQLIDLFAWDIDFAHDIQDGDTFTLLYQKIQRQGHAVVDGPILAAEFTAGGKTHSMLRYTDPAGQTGYYTPDGHSVRKALMRAPVSYSRISSGFSSHRLHPLLGFTRAHKGVDYAALSGTPVKAAGDGRITFAGSKGGYGKCIIIDHGGGYSTLYAHLSHFHHGIHSGTRVKQEQVIGYVGMTGLATGPHLHFEVRINGTPRNPRTVQLPSVAPVDVQYLADFDVAAKGLLAQLSSNGTTRLAGSAAADANSSQAAH